MNCSLFWLHLRMEFCNPFSHASPRDCNYFLISKMWRAKLRNNEQFLVSSSGRNKVHLTQSSCHPGSNVFVLCHSGLNYTTKTKWFCLSQDLIYGGAALARDAGGWTALQFVLWLKIWAATQIKERCKALQPFLDKRTVSLGICNLSPSIKTNKFKRKCTVLSNWHFFRFGFYENKPGAMRPKMQHWCLP